MPLVDLVRDPGLREILIGVLASGDRMERRLKLPAAADHVYEVLAGPLASPSTRGALAILHDITELERLERVRKDFVANVSHELRTPLAAIRGYTETLLDGALEDRVHSRRFLGIIAAQTNRLADLASDLLALAEVEGERQPRPAERLDVAAVVAHALDTVAAEASARQVRAWAPAAEPAYIAGQTDRLEQALLNLLLNAIRYNRPGGEVRVEVSQAQGTVRIAVHDTG